MEEASVTRFREYLRVKSVQPNPDYAGCLSFLKRQAADIQLPITSHEVRPSH
jgi:aminoacylase